MFVMQSGVYFLVPTVSGLHASLLEALDEVRSFDSPSPFNDSEGYELISLELGDREI